MFSESFLNIFNELTLNKLIVSVLMDSIYRLAEFARKLPLQAQSLASEYKELKYILEHGINMKLNYTVV